MIRCLHCDPRGHLFIPALHSLEPSRPPDMQTLHYELELQMIEMTITMVLSGHCTHRPRASMSINISLLDKNDTLYHYADTVSHNASERCLHFMLTETLWWYRKNITKYEVTLTEAMKNTFSIIVGIHVTPPIHWLTLIEPTVLRQEHDCCI